MSLAEDASLFRSFLADKLADPNASPLNIIMAKYGLSQLDREENNFDSSLQLIQEVINAYPDKKILLDDKGVIELAAGKTESALNTLTRAQLNLSHWAEAEKLLKYVGGEMPEYAQVYYDLGNVKSHQKKDGDSVYYLGKYYYYSGKTKLAKQMFKMAAEKKDINVKFKNDALESIKTIERVDGKD